MREHNDNEIIDAISNEYLIWEMNWRIKNWFANNLDLMLHS